MGSEAADRFFADAARIHPCRQLDVSVYINGADLCRIGIAIHKVYPASFRCNQWGGSMNDCLFENTDKGILGIQTYNAQRMMAQRRIEAVHPQIFLIIREGLIGEIKALHVFRRFFVQDIAPDSCFFIGIFFKQVQPFKINHVNPPCPF